MRKKYLSALLFGAFVFASTATFTSCKDYDDDIDNLQSQIDEAEASLSSKLAAVESSISSLQAAQTAMQSDIASAKQEAQDAKTAAAEAKVAATEAQANAIAEAEKQLTELRAELTELIQQGDNALQANIDAANAEIAKIQGSIQALQAWQGTTEATLTALAEADSNLQASLAGVKEELADVANRLGKVETGLKTQEEALSAYQTATSTDLSEIEGRLATLDEAVEKLSGLEPDDLVNMKEDITDLEGEVSALSNDIAAINENLNILYIAVYKGITHVALVDGYCVETGKHYSSNELTLLSDIAVKTYTFGSDKYGDVSIKHMPVGELEGAVSFEEGTRMKQTAYALLRVSPANATVSKNNIRLIDSQGNDLVSEGLVEVTNVNIFNGTLGSKATRADVVSSVVTGLVEVEFQVGPKADEAEFDFDGEFVDAVTVKDAQGKSHDKYFAVKISEAKEIPATGEGTSEETMIRNVVSAYSLSLAPAKNNDASELDFDVYTDIAKKTDVEYIQNRFDLTGQLGEIATEYGWKNGVNKELIYEGTTATVSEDYSDQRRWNEAYSVKAGETFYVDLSRMNKEDGVFVKYFYIILDRDFVNRTNDQDSELAAWNSYESSISGINKVYTVTDPENAVAEMKIDIEYSDIIGFRVYAANADGSLVDPDGKAFYVQVGEPAAAITVPTQEIPANINKWEMTSEFISTAELDGWDEMIAAAETSGSYIRLSLDAVMDEAIRGDKGDVDSETKLNGNVFKLELYKGNDVAGSPSYTVNQNNRTINIDILKEIKNIKIVFNHEAKYLVDNHTYTGSLTIKASNMSSYEGDGGDNVWTTVGTMELSAKKVLPEAPAGYSAKTNQIVDGKYLCYVLPYEYEVEPYNGKTDGYLKLTNSFNLVTDFNGWDAEGKPVYEEDNNYTFTFEKAAIENNETVDNKVTGYDYLLKVDNGFIEDGNAYPTTVTYDFGEISLVYDEVTNKFVSKNYSLVIDSFDTMFRCAANSETQTWAWVAGSSFLKNGVAQLTYGKSVGIDANDVSPFELATTIQGTNSYDNYKYGSLLKDFWGTDIINKPWDKATVESEIKVQMITNDAAGEPTGEINEYFEPSIRPVSSVNSGWLAVAFKPIEISIDAAPQADVPSTLRLTFKDAFGHDVVIDLPMNVHIDKGQN